MKNKSTLLIISAALLLGSGGRVLGQTVTPESTWWGGYDCIYPSLSINSRGIGSIYVPNDNSGTKDFSKFGLLIDGQASHRWDLGTFNQDPGAEHTHALDVSITGTQAPYNPLHFKYFQYDKPSWSHSWTGPDFGSNNSSGNVETATITIQGGAIRLYNTDAILKISGSTLTNANLTLPASYTMKFDAFYKGPQGVSVSGNGALTTIGNGQGVGFYAGTDQDITFNGGSILYLGPTSAYQGTIAVNTTNGAVNIKNYMGWTAGDAESGPPNTHGVALGAFTASNITVGDGDLNTYNWNLCQSLTFAKVMKPTISGNGSINIYTESQDDRVPSYDAIYLYKSVVQGGPIAFDNTVTFNFGGNTGSLQIVGQSVTFNGGYRYSSSATSPLHEISANSVNAARDALGCGVGDIWFKAPVVVEKKDGNTNWFATQDIKTDKDNAPVSYVMSGTTDTKWHAERDINMGSSVTFEQISTGTGGITWRAERDILTNRGCSSDKGFGLFDIKGTGNIFLNATRDIHTKGRVDFMYESGATGKLSLVSDTGNIQVERPLTIDVNEDSNDILISAESTPQGLTNRALGNIYTYDSVRITRNNADAGKTEVLSRNDIRTAMVDIENKVASANTYLMESHKGDIELGYHHTNPSAGCANPSASPISYDLNYFKFAAPGASTGALKVYAGFDDDTDVSNIPWGGGNIRFTRMNEALGKNSNHPTEFKIPFSNWYYCGDGTYDTPANYENAGIIGGVARCQVDATNPCSMPGLDYQGFGGELLFDAGTRGNIIINNGANLTFQGGTGNAKFLTRWGDIDMRYPFVVDSMQGNLLFLANSELPDKLNTGNCTYEEKRNNVYLQDFQYNPIQQSGSIFIGADNNIKLQYGGLKGSEWGTNQRDPFYSGDAGYPCGTAYHCDSDTSENKARNLILNFSHNGTTTVEKGGFAAVASDLIDVYKSLEYKGGQGSGMGAVPGDGSLHGEPVTGYGLYIKTQANKNNWEHSAFDVAMDACQPLKCDDPCTYPILQNTARVTFHSDARIDAENQRVYIGSPVLETFGNLGLNTHNNKGEKTNITIQTDSLIVHDGLIIDGTLTSFSTWSGLSRDMPVIKLGHQRFTPPYAEDPAECPECYTHTKTTGSVANKTAVDSMFVTFRNDASVPRLHTLVADHAVISFLTGHSKFYTDIFKVRNHVELFKTSDNTHDGRLELIPEAQMGSKSNAGIYARHLHLEPVSPGCASTLYSQLWLQDPSLDVVAGSAFGGFGMIHADVHVGSGGKLAPGYASLGKEGRCYEQSAGTLSMQDLSLDEDAEIHYSIGDVVGFDGELTDCIEVNDLRVNGLATIFVEKRACQNIEPGRYPIIRYKTASGLNRLHMGTVSIDNVALSLDISTTGVIYLCVKTIPPIIYRTLTLNVGEGIVIDKTKTSFQIESGNPFTFIITLAEGYEGQTPTVLVNGHSKGLIVVSPGKWRCILSEVFEDTDVAVGFNLTGNDTPDAPRIYSRNSQLIIETPIAATLAVYTVTGQQVVARRLAEGTTTLPLPQGFYLVKLDKQTVKVMVMK